MLDFAEALVLSPVEWFLQSPAVSDWTCYYCPQSGESGQSQAPTGETENHLHQNTTEMIWRDQEWLFHVSPWCPADPSLVLHGWSCRSTHTSGDETTPAQLDPSTPHQSEMLLTREENIICSQCWCFTDVFLLALSCCITIDVVSGIYSHLDRIPRQMNWRTRPAPIKETADTTISYKSLFWFVFNWICGWIVTIEELQTYFFLFPANFYQAIFQ